VKLLVSSPSLKTFSTIEKQTDYTGNDICNTHAQVAPWQRVIAVFALLPVLVVHSHGQVIKEEHAG